MRQWNDAFGNVKYGSAGQFIFDAAPYGGETHEGRRGLRKAALHGQGAFCGVIDFSCIRIVDLIGGHAEYLLVSNHLHVFAGMDVCGKLTYL